MKLKTILLTTVATGAFMCEPVIVHAVNSTPDSMGWFRKKKKSKPNDSVKSKNEYEKLTGDGSTIRRGMFNVYQKKNDYYFEVPMNLLGRDMLVVNKLQRVPSELNEAGVNRGTNYENQMVRFELDKATNKLLIRQSRPLPLAPAEDAISQSVRDNYISPLIAGFKIEEFIRAVTTRSARQSAGYQCDSHSLQHFTVFAVSHFSVDGADYLFFTAGTCPYG